MSVFFSKDNDDICQFVPGTGASATVGLFVFSPESSVVGGRKQDPTAITFGKLRPIMRLNEIVLFAGVNIKNHQADVGKIGNGFFLPLLH